MATTFYRHRGGRFHLANAIPLHSRAAAGFSLVELLAVMGILALLMVMLVPAVSNFGKANALTSAGNQIASLAGHARQNAITKGAMTAMVFVTEGPGSRRAVTIFEVLPREDGSAPGTNDWKQVTKWVNLPVGTAIDTSWTTLPDQTSLVLPPFLYSGSSITSYDLVVFNPDGSVFQAGSVAVPQLRVVEGLVESNSTIHYTRPGGNNHYDITILPMTGRVKIDRR